MRRISSKVSKLKGEGDAGTARWLHFELDPKLNGIGPAKGKSRLETEEK